MRNYEVRIGAVIGTLIGATLLTLTLMIPASEGDLVIEDFSITDNFGPDDGLFLAFVWIVGGGLAGGILGHSFTLRRKPL